MHVVAERGVFIYYCCHRMFMLILVDAVKIHCEVENVAVAHNLLLLEQLVATFCKSFIHVHS